MAARSARPYGAFAMRSEWRDALDRTGLPCLSLYRDEFREDLDSSHLPLLAILLGGTGDPPDVLVSAAELNALPELAILIALVDRRLAAVMA